MTTTINNVVEIIEFTDPVCTWCWGSEPVLRKLETRFGEQVKISYVMAGLVKDITAFYDSYNDIGGDPVRSNTQIAKHWLEASERHGMPVQSEEFKLFSKEYPSTYPQNIAYKAAQIQDQVLANRFLRRIREASAAEAKLTNTAEVLVELASEVGLDVARFLDDFSHGAAQKAFEEDLATTARYRAHGFPTFLVRFGKKETLLRGYKSYEEFKVVIEYLTSGTILERPTPASEAAIMAFIRTYGSVSPIEIKMTFDLTDAELQSTVDSLLTQQMITRREAGNGYFISPQISSMACDTATGICAAV
ncbi:DsbA family oxidoreductase [Oryzomonas rubra]|uniref:DsbA family protein n=1 Tax=Oryzomonas rubra TaxID=2509454 RepID=A0A5A9X4X4_9BACT|nr:DsbA family protein [Oryzomonas rubra]KAA0888117.1 DsbA family protein [Oryzomonas rubra]